MSSDMERTHSKSPSAALSDEALDRLFRAARTYTSWLDVPVADQTLRQLYDLMKFGPTSANLTDRKSVV